MAGELVHAQRDIVTTNQNSNGIATATAPPCSTATNAAAYPAPDRNAVLQALGLSQNDPKTMALVLTCERYGLDPLLKHAVLIKSSLYVTRDGLMHVAHASGKFDGLEVIQEKESGSHFVATATVWRKDMQRPFKFMGRYPKSGQMAREYGPEMAEKVAVCRALRHAFDVSLCSREEMWDQAAESAADEEGQALVPALPAVAKTASTDALNEADTQRHKAAKKAVIEAMLEFSDEAARLGHDILNDEGQPSKGKLYALYDLMQGEDANNEEPSAEQWLHNAQRMAVWTRQRRSNEVAEHKAQAKAAAAQAAGKSPADEDPFAEEKQTPAPGQTFRRTAPEPADEDVIEGEVTAQERVGANAPF